MTRVTSFELYSLPLLVEFSSVPIRSKAGACTLLKAHNYKFLPVSHSPCAHLSVGNQQITEVSDHKVLGVTIDNNLTWAGPHIRDLCKTTA